MGVQELAVVGLVGSGVGAALGVPLVWPRRDGGADPRMLGAAVLLMAAVGALISARLVGLVPGSPAVGHAVNLLGLVAFPLAVVYTRQAAGWTRAGDAWLAVPAALYLAALAGRAGLGRATEVPFAWLLPAVLGFTALSGWAAWHRRAPASDTLVPPEWVAGFMALINVAQIARMDLAHVPAARAVVPLVFAAGFVAMVTWTTARAVTRRGAADRVDEVPLPRYERSALDEDRAGELRGRIDEALTRDRLFARPDLTLGQLAAAARATPHQVSEALNRFGGVGFRDVVMRRRVDDVKAQLLDPASDRYTIEGIGASAGFRSRSALYAAFHRLEGTTPTAFRAAARTTGRSSPS
ncbi:MAG: helix-turn-helix domain-containing protein [Vicinamibacterales bacterium]